MIEVRVKDNYCATCGECVNFPGGNKKCLKEPERGKVEKGLCSDGCGEFFQKPLTGKKLSHKEINEIGRERCEVFDYFEIDEDVKKLIQHIIFLENEHASD